MVFTGNLASGKSVCQKFFEKRGYCTLDADTLVHEIIAESNPALKRVFTFVGKTRSEIAETLFRDPDLLKKWETMIHKLVYRKISGFLRNSGNKIKLVFVPLYFESPCRFHISHEVALIYAPRKVCLQRAKRKKILFAHERLQRQYSFEKTFQKAEYIVFNTRSKYEFHKTLLLMEKIITGV